MDQNEISKFEDEYGDMLSSIRKEFSKGVSKPIAWRKRQLEGILQMLQLHHDAICHAMNTDLNKCIDETELTEIFFCEKEAKHALSNLKNWMAPKKTGIPFLVVPASAQIHYEPFGVALIIGPFNYPLQLVLVPLIGAISAGNCCIIKPSELCPNISTLLSQILPLFLDTNCIKVVEGGINQTQALLRLKWDFIFFTGSERVGKIVNQAAAPHLTPVVLELGGKSPTIVDDHCNLELAAKRIIWGKTINAGQTCIAPDYVLCHERVYDRFIQYLVQNLREMLTDNPKEVPHYARIVTQGHTRRLKSLLDGSNGKIITGGDVDIEGRYISPTILTEVSLSSSIMHEEIFGPLLPVLKVSSTLEAIQIIQSLPIPLAIYIFSKRESVQKQVLAACPSGGVCINDVLMHFACTDTPFGGRGPSGLGSYHSFHSFDTFSQKRSVVIRDDHSILDVPFRYPPVSNFGRKFIRFAAKFPDLPRPCIIKFSITLLVGLGVGIPVILYFTNKLNA